LILWLILSFLARAELLTDQQFTDITPLSGNRELARRLLAPEYFEKLEKNLEQSGRRLAGQPLDLAAERFVIYVPATPPPPQGYALLVYVPPWEDAKLPPGWGPVLDQFGVVYVSAARSGNRENVFQRRVPLAVLGWHNVIKRYPIDPARVMVGGFSGGSRVAMRVALAYPDIFHGALLNSGSDEIGDTDIPLPPPDLLKRFQEETRLFYLTGERDEVNLEKDALSRQSMRKHCQFSIDAETIPFRGHELPGAASLTHALTILTTLSKTVTLDPEQLASCRARIDRR